MENPTDKEKLRLSIIDNSVPFYMTRLENVLKKNGGYFANGKVRNKVFVLNILT